jgi:hypothetical protein
MILVAPHRQGPGRRIPGTRRASQVLLALAFLFASFSVPAFSQAPSKEEAKKAPQGKTPSATPGKKNSTGQTGKSSGKSGNSSGKKSAKGKTSRRTARQRGQRAPTPQRVSEIQSALAKSGYYSGAPTGKWDAATVAAMKKYQAANDLPASGKIEARTLQKLGLGSSTAGAAAPRVAPTTTPPGPATGKPPSQR